MRAWPSSRTKPSMLACNCATLTGSTSTPSTLTRSFASLSTYLGSMVDLPLEVRETRLPEVLPGKSYPGAYSSLSPVRGAPPELSRNLQRPPPDDTLSDASQE